MFPARLQGKCSAGLWWLAPFLVQVLDAHPCSQCKLYLSVEFSLECVSMKSGQKELWGCLPCFVGFLQMVVGSQQYGRTAHCDDLMCRGLHDESALPAHGGLNCFCVQGYMQSGRAARSEYYSTGFAVDA